MADTYEDFSEPICQGDIFIPNKEDLKILLMTEKIEIPLKGFIILSNSCDIKNSKIQYISIAPIIPLNFMIENIVRERKEQSKSHGEDWVNGKIKSLLTYEYRKYFYLQKNDKLKEDCVAVIQSIMSFKRSLIEEIIIKSRICTLKSPWKEKLGWATGDLYNRISLKDYPSTRYSELMSCLN